MTQIPIIQPARWSRNGVRIVVVPGAELPRFRLEIDPCLASDPRLVSDALFTTVEEAERAAEAAAARLIRPLAVS
ncbi:hypothetical protein GSU68_12770 [Rathayibacter sp. VKM Ac-2759]|uniref:hypothetical protein n=1 Tax=Rathayibacter sp. VKM Ac-2759 TaxID=2609252 RepID=UPI0013179DF9|nr:hypothetical protein [Rathayibacter sp. VKM Ac-2759]QHC67349.1 hypothetical protein GSU68_12770 [Rathayibacter sp. VKM Ac-2759]